MGYTHYFTQTQTVDIPLWQNFGQHLTLLYRHYQANPISAKQICGGYLDEVIVLCDGGGELTLTPETLFLDEDTLCFNGEASRELDHETFVIHRQMPDGHGRSDTGYWDFCKTAYKPYDVFVTAALLLLHNLCTGCFSVGSDGDAHEWQLVLDYVRAVFPQLRLSLPDGIAAVGVDTGL